MVQDSRLGGAGVAEVVVDGDRVQELGPRVDVECGRPLLDQAQSEVDVPEQRAFAGRQGEGAAVELSRPPDVVEEGGGGEQVGAESGWTLAVSRQSVATLTVCSRRPPA